MSVKTLIADPEFSRLSAEEKQGVLASVDPEFQNIGVGEIDAVIEGIRASSPPPPKPPSTFQKVMGKLDTLTQPLTYPEKAAKMIMPMMTKAQSAYQNKFAKLTGIPIQEEPTGNLTRDVIANLPRIINETAEEVGPSTVSRAAILTAGGMKAATALKPLAVAGGKMLAKGAESISGLEYKTPGVLTEAFNDPKLIFASGKKSAGPIYEAAKEAGGEVRKSLSNIPEKVKLVKESLKLATKGELNATEALEARKELSAIKKTVSGEFYRKSKEVLNEVAKPIFEKADKVYERGTRADALRLLLPVNKGGGTSIAKSTLGTIAGIVPLGAMSPVVQGAAATGAGIASRFIAPALSNPVIPAAALTLTVEMAKKFLKEARGNKEKARKLAQEKGYLIPEVGQ